MTRITRRQPQLSESWADMDDDSHTSEEEFQPRIREAYYNSHKSGTLSNPPNSTGFQESPAQKQPSSTRRKRNASQISSQSEFVMPTPESSGYLETPPTRTTRHSPRPAVRASAIRKSVPIKRATPVAQPTRRKAAKTTTQDTSLDYVHYVWRNAALPLLKYVLSVFSIAAHALKPLLGYTLIVLIMAAGIGIAKTMVVHSVSNALSLLCNIPGAGFLNLPFCDLGHDGRRGPVEFDKLVITQSNFEDILEASVHQAALPLAMKNSELSIRDLRTVVRHSSLGSRNELVNEFDGFIETARQASDGLSQFNSRISRALDGILSANRWTMKVLQGIEAAPDSEGIVPRFFSQYLSFLSLAVPQHSTQDVIYDQYIRHTSEVEEQIKVCILEANTLLEVLENLDDRLHQIQDIAHREDLKVGDAKAELLGLLWTKLGGNRGPLAKQEQQLATLNDVGRYRKTAMQHVISTLVKLKDIENNLSQLRDDVAAPTIVDRERMPLEMHIDLISSAVDRLQTVRDEGRREKEKMLQGTLHQINEHSTDKRIG
ncbi:hypothetical protein E4T52_00053 [Aureobasidium sp. EXF-3400]|nr:hypothetical protein E4T51_01896 [Aureobasidium sp. EXF-12344]KAI4785033.1 hypothetical protein E4T52_00053 [Aureobasidium sp. EXF-3400]